MCGERLRAHRRTCLRHFVHFNQGDSGGAAHPRHLRGIRSRRKREQQGRIPAGRIGILNAVVAPTAADRQRTAREFNGSEGVAPKYDVLIANMIGEEGVVEGPSRKDPSVTTGRTRQNKLVHFASPSPLRVGTYAEVLVTSAAPPAMRWSA